MCPERTFCRTRIGKHTRGAHNDGAQRAYSFFNHSISHSKVLFKNQIMAELSGATLPLPPAIFSTARLNAATHISWLQALQKTLSTLLLDIINHTSQRLIRVVLCIHFHKLYSRTDHIGHAAHPIVGLKFFDDSPISFTQVLYKQSFCFCPVFHTGTFTEHKLPRFIRLHLACNIARNGSP